MFGSFDAASNEWVGMVADVWNKVLPLVLLNELSMYASLYLVVSPALSTARDNPTILP